MQLNLGHIIFIKKAGLNRLYSTLNSLLDFNDLSLKITFDFITALHSKFKQFRRNSFFNFSSRFSIIFQLNLNAISLPLRAKTICAGSRLKTARLQIVKPPIFNLSLLNLRHCYALKLSSGFLRNPFKIDS